MIYLEKLRFQEMQSNTVHAHNDKKNYAFNSQFAFYLHNCTINL